MTDKFDIFVSHSLLICIYVFVSITFTNQLFIMESLKRIEHNMHTLQDALRHDEVVSPASSLRSRFATSRSNTTNTHNLRFVK